MKLSIVIVNYNVEYFLEQCLNSVQKAIDGLPAEVFVVDNNSFDSSCRMVKEKFPWVKLIENKDNLGFSKANNQAMRIATGEYVLLLNPDTVVEEDTFKKTVAFMDEHPDGGGLGVYMIDGRGRFLPESKRGLPTPWVSFCKISGLSKLFPRSKRFNRYHAGYIDKNQTSEIEILSGAFMLMRKTALDKVGLLDERFFMYGEDIDLSYRIILGGYKNYYFANTRIIHYKGESTRKNSVNYVLVFYNAMIIFAKKHFSQKNARLFAFLIRCAIYLRAGAALVNRFLSRIIVPAADAAGIMTLMWLIAWQYQLSTGIAWPPHLVRYAMGAYTFLWLGSAWLTGAYDKPLKAFNCMKGFVLGTGIILVFYGLLPKEVQFSRSYILFSAGAAFFWFMLLRLVFTMLRFKPYMFGGKMIKNIAIIGLPDEADRVLEMLRQSNVRMDVIKRIAPATETNTAGYDARISQLGEFVHTYGINEVIFCARDNTAGEIMTRMSNITSGEVDFKIAQPDSAFIIGSNSVNTTGEAYTLDIQTILQPTHRRNKRIVDFTFSLLFILFSPVLVWMVKNKAGFLKNMVAVFIGKKSLVGTDNQVKNTIPGILKPGILPCTLLYNHYTLNSTAREKINFLYTRDYRTWTDIRLIFSNFRSLGQ